jgi:hypothetical protein
MDQRFHRARPETWERISIKLAFSVAQGSISFQSSPRIWATLVVQDRVDKPTGRGVVLRPCAKSSITIPIEVARKALEQEARLNSVYKPYRGPVSTSIIVASKSSAYVFGHFGTILVFDTPCGILRWLVFIDDSHGQARNCICVENLLHKLHDVGCEDRAIRTGLSTFKVYYGRIHGIVKRRKDGEEEPEPHGGTY